MLTRRKSNDTKAVSAYRCFEPPKTRVCALFAPASSLRASYNRARTTNRGRGLGLPRQPDALGLLVYAMAAWISDHSAGEMSAAPDCRATASPSEGEHPRTRAMAAPAIEGVRLMQAPQ
jgi:hypothetical protein